MEGTTEPTTASRRLIRRVARLAASPVWLRRPTPWSSVVVTSLASLDALIDNALMKMLVTGTDQAGRSCIVEVRDLAGPERAMVFGTSEVPPGPRPPGHGQFRDLGVAPGATLWVVAHFEPETLLEMHHTDSIDYDVVLAGSIYLVLDDGEHLLEMGDCAVVTGVDHNWRAGPDGCTLSAVILGSTPPPG